MPRKSARPKSSLGKYVPMAAVALVLVVIGVGYAWQAGYFSGLTYEQRRVRNSILEDARKSPVIFREWYPPEHVSRNMQEKEHFSNRDGTAVHVRFAVQRTWPAGQPAPMSLQSLLAPGENETVKPGDWIEANRVVVVYCDGTFYDSPWPLKK